MADKLRAVMLARKFDGLNAFPRYKTNLLPPHTYCYLPQNLIDGLPPGTPAANPATIIAAYALDQRSIYTRPGIATSPVLP